MRYRALARSGQAVSTLTLRIDDRTPAEARQSLTVAALEAGINAFDIGGADPAIMDAVGPVLAEVDRHMLYISLRLGSARTRTGELVRDFSAERLVRVIDACAARMGIGYVDLALLDDPASDELPTRSLAALKAAREAGRARWLGVAGDGEAMDAYLNIGAFDVLVTPYNLTSGWQVRNRLKRAGADDMSVIGTDPLPDALKKRPSLAAAPVNLLSRLLGKGGGRPRVDPGSHYSFLEHTPGWTAEEVCIAYALTEPALASIMVSPETPEHLAALASVPDREIPSHLPAQIEMARFSAVA
jgi:aryl-alcohol dehydrogenase-like predicted oxidoreductase